MNFKNAALVLAAGALSTQIAVRLVVFPKLRVMSAGETAGRREAPVFVHDERPEFGVDSSRADGNFMIFYLQRCRETERAADIASQHPSGI